MNIKVLGPGCAKCHDLLKNTREAIKDIGIDATIEDVNDIRKIISYNVISTPGLVIDEKVVSTGKVLNKKELIQIIQKAAAATR
jgi:small redox-active disulfide protein 2